MFMSVIWNHLKRVFRGDEKLWLVVSIWVAPLNFIWLIRFSYIQLFRTDLERAIRSIIVSTISVEIMIYLFLIYFPFSIWLLSINSKTPFMSFEVFQDFFA